MDSCSSRHLPLPVPNSNAVPFWFSWVSPLPASPLKDASGTSTSPLSPLSQWHLGRLLELKFSLDNCMYFGKSHCWPHTVCHSISEDSPAFADEVRSSLFWHKQGESGFCWSNFALYKQGHQTCFKKTCFVQVSSIGCWPTGW